MANIISTIDQLVKTAKINASIPFPAVEPFLNTARDIYLERYLGIELLEVLESDTIPERATELIVLVRKALGPLAIWLGNAELSVRFGDNGFTVSAEQGKTLAASDSKIAKVEESLQRRGFQYLDKVLEYLEENAADFPEWTESRFYSLRGGNYILSAKQFQEIGLVDIEYSRLTFETFRPLMSMIETRFVTETLGVDLDLILRSKLSGTPTPTASETKLITSIRQFIACKTAELHTSKAGKIQREASGTPEYKPLIRPIYSDPQNEGNFFSEQAVFYWNKVQQILNKYAVEFGKEPFNPALDFNNADMKIFVAP